MLNETIRRIESLRLYGENWNGCNVDAPREDSILAALEFVKGIYPLIEDTWLEPHISADEEGNVVFWWAKGTRRDLEVYIEPERNWYLKTEGSGGGDTIKMEDGNITIAAFPETLWNWMLS